MTALHAWCLRTTTTTRTTTIITTTTITTTTRSPSSANNPTRVRPSVRKAWTLTTPTALDAATLPAFFPASRLRRDKSTLPPVYLAVDEEERPVLSLAGSLPQQRSCLERTLTF